jgi:hypothetical protein
VATDTWHGMLGLITCGQCDAAGGWMLQQGVGVGEKREPTWSCVSYC